MFTVELYAKIRRAVMVDGLSRREAAKQFGVRRNTIAKMLQYSAPPSFGAGGRMTGDVISVEGDPQPGEPLLRPVMRQGRRLGPSPSLAEIRDMTGRGLRQLPEELRRLDAGIVYLVTVAERLIALADQVDRDQRAREQEPGDDPAD
jgi:hypothetical protein